MSIAYIILLLSLFGFVSHAQLVSNCTVPCGTVSINATINALGIVAIYDFTTSTNCSLTEFLIPLPNCTNLYGYDKMCVLNSTHNLNQTQIGCGDPGNFTDFISLNVNTSCSQFLLIWDAYLRLNETINYVDGFIQLEFQNESCASCHTLVPKECAPLPANFTTSTTGVIATTAVQTTGQATTGIATTAVATTSIATTQQATTAVPTTAVPTTAIPTTQQATTAVPTTAVPTTGVVTTSAFTTGVVTTSQFISTTIPHTTTGTQNLKIIRKGVVSGITIGIMIGQFLFTLVVIWLMCILMRRGRRAN